MYKQFFLFLIFQCFVHSLAYSQAEVYFDHRNFENLYGVSGEIKGQVEIEGRIFLYIVGEVYTDTTRSEILAENAIVEFNSETFSFELIEEINEYLNQHNVFFDSETDLLYYNEVMDEESGELKSVVREFDVDLNIINDLTDLFVQYDELLYNRTKLIEHNSVYYALIRANEDNESISELAVIDKEAETYEVLFADLYVGIEAYDKYFEKSGDKLFININIDETFRSNENITYLDLTTNEVAFIPYPTEFSGDIQKFSSINDTLYIFGNFKYVADNENIRYRTRYETFQDMNLDGIGFSYYIARYIPERDVWESLPNQSRITEVSTTPSSLKIFDLLTIDKTIYIASNLPFKLGDRPELTEKKFGYSNLLSFDHISGRFDIVGAGFITFIPGTGYREPANLLINYSNDFLYISGDFYYINKYTFETGHLTSVSKGFIRYKVINQLSTDLQYVYKIIHNRYPQESIEFEIPITNRSGVEMTVDIALYDGADSFTDLGEATINAGEDTLRFNLTTDGAGVSALSYYGFLAVQSKQDKSIGLRIPFWTDFTENEFDIHPILIFEELPGYVNAIVQVTAQLVKNGVDVGNTSLTKERLTLFENDVQVSESESIINMTKLDDLDHSLKTVLLIDNSFSLGSDLEKVKSAAKIFIDEIGENQEVAIYTFSGPMTVVNDFTKDKEVLKKSIDKINLGSSTTDLYRSVIEALNLWQDSISYSHITLGNLVLFTDGKDTSGRSTLEQVIAAKADKQIISVGLGPEVEEDILNSISSAGVFLVDNVNQLQSTFRELGIVQDSYFNSYYWINYRSPKFDTSIIQKFSVQVRSNRKFAEAVFSYDPTGFYLTDNIIRVNSSATDPSGVNIIEVPANSSKVIDIESYFTFVEEPFVFEISDSELLTISKSDTRTGYSFTGNAEEGQEVTVNIADTVFSELNLSKSITVKFGEAVETSTTNESLIPTVFGLHQNYPNPFNPGTNIKFDLPRSSDVNLIVYNLLGEQVTELVNKRLSAGEHSVNFDASQLSSGVYIYRIQAGSFVQTKKMMLIK